MANGILSEIANASKDVGVGANRTVDAMQGVADYRMKMAKVRDFEQEEPTRKAEYKTRKKEAEHKGEIITEYGDKIKESTALKIENEISNMKKANQWNEMQQIDSTLQGVRDEESYQMVIDNLPPAQLRKYDIEPDKGFEENKPAIKYLADRVQHDLKQRQAMEMQSLKGMYAAQAASNRAGYTPDPTSTLPTGDYFSQVMLSMENDPAFSGMIGFNQDMGTSPAFQQAASMVAGEFEGIVKQNADLNRQRAKQGLDPIRMSKADALETAKQRAKAYMFDGIEDSWLGFGPPKMQYMDPEEALEREQEWRVSMWPQVMQDEQFKNLPDEEQELVLRRLYLKEKMIRHQDAMQKLGGRINSR